MSIPAPRLPEPKRKPPKPPRAAGHPPEEPEKKGKPAVPGLTQALAISLDSIDGLELARQLTLMDFERFAKIHPRECLDSAWIRSANQQATGISSLTPGISGTIEWFNAVGSWAQAVVLEGVGAKARARCFVKMVRVAKHLRALNNFSSLLCVYSALTSGIIDRMEVTMQLVPVKVLRELKELGVSLLNSEFNHRALRHAMEQSTPPLVPYLGMLLNDLALIDEGNKTILAEGHVNFYKCRLIMERIQTIERYQQSRYNFPDLPVIRRYLEESCFIRPQGELRLLSMELEPS